jgi:hypothetical protein
VEVNFTNTQRKFTFPPQPRCGKLPGMAIVLLTFGTVFAALCIWLAVRFINRRERWATWTAVVLPFAMMIIYAGAYFALAQERLPNTFGYGARPGISYCDDDHPLVYRPATDREILLARFFQPAHWIDQHIVRPGYWAY